MCALSKLHWSTGLLVGVKAEKNEEQLKLSPSLLKYESGFYEDNNQLVLEGFVASHELKVFSPISHFY